MFNHLMASRVGVHLAAPSSSRPGRGPVTEDTNVVRCGNLAGTPLLALRLLSLGPYHHGKFILPGATKDALKALPPFKYARK